MATTPIRAFIDERGASAVEYSLLVVLIAAVVVGTVTVLGGQVTDLFDSLIGLF